MKKNQEIFENQFSGDYLYVVSTGRRSGKKHVVKVRYVVWEDDHSVCVLYNANPRTGLIPDWISNALSREGDSILYTSQYEGKINQIVFPLESGPDSERYRRTLELFARKYGKYLFRELGYYRNARPVIISFEKSNTVPEEASLRSLEFDFQAERYTSIILGNPISRWEREVTVDYISKLFPPGANLFEIGAGTGIETLALAARGFNLFAIDFSEKMLEILSRRALAMDLQDKIKMRLLSSSMLNELEKEGREGFDGAFSNFGTMNLEDDLESFSTELAKLLKPKAKIVFAVWNRFCLTDIVAKLLFKRESSRERLAGFVKADSTSKYSLDTYAYGPREFASFFSNNFQVRSWFSLPSVLIPPSEYSRRAFLKLKRYDLAIGRLPILKSIGDNFVITMEMKT